MEPWDYCEHWVKHIQPSDRGYRAECVRELEKATFGQYKFETINKKWGARFQKRPNSVLKLLEANHVLRTIENELASVNSQLTELLRQIHKITHSE